MVRRRMPKLRRAYPIRSVRRRRSLGNDDSAWCRRLMKPSFRAGCLSLFCCPSTVSGASSTRLVIHKLSLHAVRFDCSLSSSFDILPDLRGRAAVAVDDDDEDDQCQASPPSRANNQPWQTCIAQSHWNCRRVPYTGHVNPARHLSTARRLAFANLFRNRPLSNRAKLQTVWTLITRSDGLTAPSPED